jgi:hypothetical protein
MGDRNKIRRRAHPIAENPFTATLFVTETKSSGWVAAGV